MVLEKGQVVDHGSYDEIILRTPDLIEEEVSPASDITFVDAQPNFDEQTHPDNENASLLSEERVQEEVLSWKQDGSWSVYSYYYKSAGTLSIFLWALCTIISAVSTNYARKSNARNYSSALD